MENRWDMDEQVDDVDMKELLLVILRKAWLVVIAAVLCAGLAYIGTKALVQPQYRSSVLFYVNNTSVTAEGLISSLLKEDLDVAKHMVDTYEVILKTRGTLDNVLATAGVDMDAETLNDCLELTSILALERVEETELFRVHVIWKNPAEAQKLANAVAEVLPERIAEIIDDTSARIVDSAVRPLEPIAPDAKNSFILGGLLGVVMSAGFVALRYLFDSKIRSVTFLNRYGKLPVLAVIPELNKK